MSENKLKVIIVDDEPLARDYIRLLLENEREFEIVGEASNGKKALELIENLEPDLVFLDVQMPEMDGFSMLGNLGKEQIPTIIFTTAYEEYAIRAFEFHAIDYLLKPFDQKRFVKALNYAKNLAKNETRQDQNSHQIKEMLDASKRETPYLERLLIKQNGKVIFLKTSDIDCIKADDKYVHLYFDKSNYMVRQTLSAMLEQLDPRKFVQIHRSVIVNLESVKELHQTFNGQYDVILENGMDFSLSRKFQDELFGLLGKPL